MVYQDNDYELLYLISENNEEAKELLYLKYKELVNIKAKKYYSYLKKNGIDLNDLIQEGMIGLTQAINGFKEQKNTSFETFANKCIDLHLLTYVRVNTNNKNFVLNNSISMDSLNENGKSIKDFISDKKNKNPEELFINKELKTKIEQIKKEKFSDLERKVFDLRTSGYSYNEIKDKLNVTLKSAQHAMERAKNKIEKEK